MLKFMKSWCEGIIIAVFISIIIEMLVPEGNNKKYIKVVSGIFIIFVILNPILENINMEMDIDFQNVFQLETIETSSDFNNNMKDVYIIGIEDTIKNEISEKGYVVDSVKVMVDSNYENIEKIEIVLCKSNNISIEPINIGEDKIVQEDIELKNFISEKYQIDIDKVFVFQN